MRNIALKLSALACLLLFTGCPTGDAAGGDATVTIINNSPKTLRYYFDTAQIVRHDPTSFRGPDIQPYSERKDFGWWKESFQSVSVQRLFLFDKAVTDSVPFDTIRANNMYLKRIDFTLKTLDSLKWTLTYP